MSKKRSTNTKDVICAGDVVCNRCGKPAFVREAFVGWGKKKEDLCRGCYCPEIVKSDGVKGFRVRKESK